MTNMNRINFEAQKSKKKIISMKKKDLFLLLFSYPLLFWTFSPTTLNNHGCRHVHTR